MRCRRFVLSPWHFSLLALLILLASCQGSQFGAALEEAVAPVSPRQSERSFDPDDLTSDDLVSPEDRVDPDDLPTLEDRLTPNDDNLGNLSPGSSDTASPESSANPDRNAPQNDSTVDDEIDRETTDDSVSESGRQNRFRDLDVNPQTAEAIAALDDLDVFEDIENDNFQPNRSVRRQEFARWVTLAYNALYSDEPNRQLVLADDSETPLFLDVPEDRPEFPHIQALANAGIVEMRADREFEPDNLLSRADLISIKVALDLGVNSLDGTLADVERDWAFADASDIRAGDIPAVASDFTLGDASNIRRIFGPLEDFDPQAPVTRAQVALALMSFGVGGSQRSVTAVDEAAVDEPATAMPDEVAPRQLEEDDSRPQSAKNPPQRDTPGSTQSPDRDTQPGSDLPLSDRDSVTPNAEEPQDGGGRFLDL
ncbi:MAG: S-layer homology domain-containing protein [Synechococcus sp.]